MSKNLYPLLPVLLVDDEEAWLHSFGLTLRSAGMNNVLTLNDSREVIELLHKQEISVLILDLTMPHISGDELLPVIAKEFPHIPVLIITGLDQIETAVSCMRLGAYDFYPKVAEESRLLAGVRRAIDLGHLRRENSSLKEHFLEDKLDHPEAFSEIITHNKAMRSIFQYIEAIATTCEPVLITGETGVGKELIAQSVHKLSERNGEFVAVNIAGLDDTMLSDALFGHRKGAFSGADSNRKGLIVKASDGSFFLDEIGDLSQGAQVKLLRLIQEREYYPLGSDIARSTNVRMIFATHQNLDSLQNSGTFRQDLFFRLRTHHIHIPPLRDRLEDLEPLLDHFLTEAAEKLGKKKPNYPRELVILLGTYSYPGNIRELQAMVFDAVSKHKSRTLSMDAFKEYMQTRQASCDLLPERRSTETPFAEFITLPTIKESSQLLVEESLKRAKGNQAIAAQMLGISRQALNWRIKQQE